MATCYSAVVRCGRLKFCHTVTWIIILSEREMVTWYFFRTIFGPGILFRIDRKTAEDKV